MFGGILGRLLGRGASRVSSQYSDDILRNAVTAGMDENAARSALTNLVPKSKSSNLVRQLKEGVDNIEPVNTGIDPDSVVSGATTKTLRDNKGVRNKIANIGEDIEEAGTKLKNNQIVGTIRDRKLLERAPDAIATAEKYGFTPNQYGRLAEITTGKNGFYSTANKNILNNSKQSMIMPDAARQKALKSVDRLITVEPHVQKNLRKAISDAHDITTSRIGERLTARGEKRASALNEADVADVHSAIQDLEKLAYETTGKNARGIQKILRSYADDLKKDLNEVTKPIYQNPETRQQITAALEGANLSPQYTKDISDLLRKGDFDYLTARSLQSPFVTLGKIAEHEKMAPLAAGLNGGGGGGGGGLLGGPLAQVMSEVAGKPVAKGVGKVMQVGGRATQLASKSGSGVGKGGMSPLTVAGLGAGSIGVLGNLMGGGQSSPQLAMQSMDGIAGDSNIQGPEQELTVGGYGRDQLEESYVNALLNGDTDSAKYIGSLIDMLDNKEDRLLKSNSKSSKSGSNSEKLANASRAMNNLMTVYEQGGGAQGPLGALSGLLNKATFGALNPQQAAYEDMLQAAAVQVARANGETGVLSNQDIQNYKKMLPTFSDNPLQSQIKLQTIMSGLQSN